MNLVDTLTAKWLQLLDEVPKSWQQVDQENELPYYICEAGQLLVKYGKSYCDFKLVMISKNLLKKSKNAKYRSDWGVSYNKIIRTTNYRFFFCQAQSAKLYLADLKKLVKDLEKC